MNYKIDNKLEDILNELKLIEDVYPNFTNIWREYLFQKMNNLNKQLEKVDMLVKNIDNLDNDIPIFLLFMLINN